MMSMLLPGESLVQKKTFFLFAPAGGAPGAAQRARCLFFLAGSIRGQPHTLTRLCSLLWDMLVGARAGGAVETSAEQWVDVPSCHSSCTLNHALMENWPTDLTPARVIAELQSSWAGGAVGPSARE